MGTQNDALEALFAEISRQAGLIASGRLNPISEASAVKDLAAAYRLAAGGPQPGGSVISS